MTEQQPEQPYEVPKHEYETVAGTPPQPYVEHEPRTVEHRTVRVDNTDLSMMTEIGDGTFVQWTTCRKCGLEVGACTDPEGPVEPKHMANWRDKRFAQELNQRPDPEYPMLESVLEWARTRGYVVTKADVGDTLFAKLFEAVSACEAPPGTQVDDVLDTFQEAYSAVTGKPMPQWCWECEEDGQKSPATESDENGPLCEGCYDRRVEDGLITIETIGEEVVGTSEFVPPGSTTVVVDSLTEAMGEVVEKVRAEAQADEEDDLRLIRKYDAEHPDEDDLSFARETLGPEATEDEVANLAEQRADRDLKEYDVDF